MSVSTLEKTQVGELKAEVEEMTPTMARRILDAKGKNRKLSHKTVQRYMLDMKEGRWKLNGEAIVLDTDGKLLDGQHRLEACILSNAPFRTVVVRGADPSAFATLDTGLKRNVVTVLQMRGEQNAAVLGAALRAIVQIETSWDMSSPDRTSAILEALERHPRIRQSVSFIESLKKDLTVVMAISAPAAIHYLGWQKHNHNKADEFWVSVATGENLDQFDPRYALRRRMLGVFGAIRRDANLRRAACAYSIKAWNSWIAGDEIAQLRWDSNKEPFPEIS